MSELVLNPLAQVLNTLHYDIEMELNKLAEQALCHKAVDFEACNGLKRADSADNTYRRRTATNEECNDWALHWTTKIPIDLRKRIPRQLIKGIRLEIARLARMAELFETVKDYRDLEIIKKLIGDDTYLPMITEQGLEFDWEGKLMPIGYDDEPEVA